MLVLFHVVATPQHSLMAAKLLLTKSLFQRGCNCPRKIAYAALQYPESEPDEFLQSLARDGNLVGMYAQWMFPDGFLVSPDNPNESTRAYLDQNETVTLFEADFRWRNCFARADILQKVHETSLHLMEVKLKSFHPHQSTIVGKRGGIRAEFAPILRDIAFQTFVCRQAFPSHSVRASLLLPNKAAVNSIPQLYTLMQSDAAEAKRLVQQSADDSKLLLQLDVTEFVDLLLESELSVGEGTDKVLFSDVVGAWSAALENNEDDLLTSFPKSMGRRCRDCEFPNGFETCWGTHKADNLVLDIIRGGAKIDGLIQQGKYKMSALQSSDFATKSAKLNRATEGGITLADRQVYQIKSVDLVVDREFASRQMEKLDYPLHFIDFETSIPPLPYHAGCRPYQNLAFQFSHHILNEDGTLVHATEFLADSRENPNSAFLRALCLALEGKPGTVFRWGAHENTVLANLLSSETDQADVEFLHSLTKGGSGEMIDLMALAGSAYYVRGSGGSTSLKKLIVPTMRHSSHLRHLYGQPTYSSSNFSNMQWYQQVNADEDPLNPYSLLTADGVFHGTDAMAAYNRLQTPVEDIIPAAGNQEATRSSLLKYCELDTLAMVFIFQALQGFLRDGQGMDPEAVERL